MILSLKNCNNILSGQVEIHEGCLNIKYAINGTGKSTIAKTLEAFTTNDENLKDDLVPYRYFANPDVGRPEVSGIDSIHSIAIFNEDYINRHVFTESDLLENSFSIFVKSPKYDEHMEKIGNLLIEVANAFNTHPELDELITVFSDFIKSFGSSQNNISKSSPIAKALGNGNKLKSIPLGLEKYEPYLLNSKEAKNVSWLKWQITGREYLDIVDQCPYCTASIASTKEQIIKVSEEYNAKEIEHLNRLLDLFENLIPYFSDATARKIEEIRDNISDITQQQKDFLIGVRTDIQNFTLQLTKVKGIGYRSLSTADKMADELKSFVIDLTCFVHLGSTKIKSKVDLINNTMQKVIDLAGKLQGEVKQQNNLIAQTIKDNKSIINTFLNKAGYNYEVDILETTKSDYKMILKPIELDYEIRKVKSHLSYGERNALALALFAFSVQKTNPDLIVLDDPISSFDGNKKFALIDLLFLTKHSLKHRTVVLLTHEFNTVIDILKTKIRSFNPQPTASFLNTKKGILTEKEIKGRDICTIQRISKTNIDAVEDNLIKLIYLRRMFEFSDDKGLVWQITSSLLHKRATPLIDTETEKRIMTQAEITEATELISKHIPDFDYSTEYNKAVNISYMKDLYRNAQSNFEKLQIFRIIFNAESNNSVLKKFINETYHVGNDYVYQLNPREFDTIPQYIVDICDNELSKLA